MQDLSTNEMANVCYWHTVYLSEMFTRGGGSVSWTNEGGGEQGGTGKVLMLFQKGSCH